MSKTPTLKPVRKAAKGHNRFCGPAALSIIAGVDTAEAAAVLRHVSGKRSVQGTSNWEVLRALSLLGYRATSAAKVNPNERNSNPTLAAWLRDDARDGRALYLVNAGYHWQVVQGRRLCCGLTGEIVSIRDGKAKRRARVVGVWKIEQERKVALAEVLPIKAKARQDAAAKSEASARRKAQRLATLHGIEIEIDRFDGYTRAIVWGPGFKDEADDPYEGDHTADDWADALARVETYVEIVTAQPDLLEGR